MRNSATFLRTIRRATRLLEQLKSALEQDQQELRKAKEDREFLWRLIADIDYQSLKAHSLDELQSTIAKMAERRKDVLMTIDGGMTLDTPENIRAQLERSD